MLLRLSSFRAFAARIFRRFIEENFDQISASLAFTTLLSLVPLVAVVLGVISVLPGFLGMIDQLDQFVVRSLLPERSAGMIIKYVLQFSQKAADVTLVGLSVLLTTVSLLLMSIERALNHVWSVTENRPWWRRVRLYAAVLALWPLIVTCVVVAISFAVTESLGLVDEPPWLRNLLFKAAGLSVAAIFFSGLYFSVPNARVQLRDALWAGLFAAFGFLLMQKAFGFYLSHFPSFTLVYGAFATVPIFLLWLYLSWAVVLLGALVAATLPEFRGKCSQDGAPV
ncbi:YihY family inner membrane protein [Propionivibrio sp.]|uniref:YihY family inner membrane protein n=1 Tax=Propionivibrio sp. TaxID=2212460 RepID=UPI003BF2D1F9